MRRFPFSLLFVGLLLAVLLAAPTTGQAATRLIPHITGGDISWTDTLEVDNTGTNTASYTITLYNGSGSVVYGPTSFSLAPNGYSVHNLKNLAPTAATGQVGHSDLALKFRVAYENQTGGGVAEFPLADSGFPTIHFLFPNFAGGSMGFLDWKGIALYNPNATTASVTLTAYGSQEVVGTTTVSLPGHSRLVGFVSGAPFFSGLGMDEIERVTATSSANIAGISISGDTASSRLLFSVAGPTPTESGILHIPHITGGQNDWRDWLQMDNLGDAPVTYILTMVGDDGSALASGITGSIQPGEYRAENLKSYSSTAGSAIVTYSGNVSFRVAYENRAGGGVAEFNLTQGGLAGKSVLEFLFANFTSLVEWKGFAIQNTGTTSSSVDITAYTQSGPFGTVSKTIPPKARIVAQHNAAGYFPGLPLAQLTRIRVSSSSANLGGITISGNNAGDKLLSTLGLAQTSGDDGSGDGGDGGGGDPDPDPVEITSNTEASQAINKVAGLEAKAWAASVAYLTNNFTSKLFTNVPEVSDAQYDAIFAPMLRLYDEGAELSAAFEYLAASGGNSPAAKYARQVLGQTRFDGVVFNHVAYPKTMIDKAQENLGKVIDELPQLSQFAAYAAAKLKYPDEDLGDTPLEFADKLKNKELPQIAPGLIKEIHDNVDDATLQAAMEAAKADPTSVAQAAAGGTLNEGLDLVSASDPGEMDQHTPEADGGYSEAADAADKLDDLYQDQGGIHTDGAKNEIGPTAEEFLEELEQVGGFIFQQQQMFAEAMAQETSVMDVSNEAEEDKQQAAADKDLGFVSPAPPQQIGLLEAIEFLQMFGFPEDALGGITDVALIFATVFNAEVIAEEQLTFPMPPGDYDVNNITEDSNDEIAEVTVNQDEGVVIPSLILQGADDIYTLSASASPANPGPGQNVTVTARVTPPTAGLTIQFSIAGSDGYSNSATATTGAAGTATFSIPGGSAGTRDEVTVVLQDTGQTIVFSYVF